MFVRNDMTVDARVLKEAASLRDDGHAVTIVGVTRPGTPRDVEREPRDGFEIVRVPLPRWRWWWRWLRLPSRVWSMVKARSTHAREGERMDGEQDAVEMEAREHRHAFDRVHDHRRPDREGRRVDVVIVVHVPHVPTVLVLEPVPEVRHDVTDHEVENEIPAELEHRRRRERDVREQSDRVRHE